MTVSWTSDDSLAAPVAAGRSRRGSGAKNARRSAAWPYAIARRLIGVSGLIVLLILWWIGTDVVSAPDSFVRHFSPAQAFTSLVQLATHSDLPIHILVSLRRVLIGLGAALLIGVPVGLAVGSSGLLNAATSPAFQFLRMISPLSWMPLAVMVFGVGDRPIYFLLDVRGGMADPSRHSRRRQAPATRLASPGREPLGDAMGNTALHHRSGHTLARRDRIAACIGIVWIVLVPCEMLGVSAGLGYFILDTRDRLAYSELTAMVLIIGLLGFLLDAGARGLYRLATHGRG